MNTIVETCMVIALFLMGMVMIVAGLIIILAREYQETLKTLSSQSVRLSKSLKDEGIQPILEGSSRLLESVTKMIQTAVGTGAFLCLLGTVLCGLSFWMARSIPR
jgi:hypothetical protein